MLLRPSNRTLITWPKPLDSARTEARDSPSMLRFSRTVGVGYASLAMGSTAGPQSERGLSHDTEKLRYEGRMALTGEASGWELPEAENGTWNSEWS